jgi:hypothetical protein
MINIKSYIATRRTSPFQLERIKKILKTSILIRGRRVPSTEHIELRGNKMCMDSTTTKCLININEDLRQYGRDYEQD